MRVTEEQAEAVLERYLVNPPPRLDQIRDMHAALQRVFADVPEPSTQDVLLPNSMEAHYQAAGLVSVHAERVATLEESRAWWQGQAERMVTRCVELEAQLERAAREAR